VRWPHGEACEVGEDRVGVVVPRTSSLRVHDETVDRRVNGERVQVSASEDQGRRRPRDGGRVGGEGGGVLGARVDTQPRDHCSAKRVLQHLHYGGASSF